MIAFVIVKLRKASPTINQQRRSTHNHLLTRSHARAHSRTHSLFPSLPPSLPPSLTHSLTHPLTHSLTRVNYSQNVKTHTHTHMRTQKLGQRSGKANHGPSPCNLGGADISGSVPVDQCAFALALHLPYLANGCESYHSQLAPFQDTFHLLKPPKEKLKHPVVIDALKH